MTILAVGETYRMKHPKCGTVEGRLVKVHTELVPIDEGEVHKYHWLTLELTKPCQSPGWHTYPKHAGERIALIRANVTSLERIAA